MARSLQIQSDFGSVFHDFLFPNNAPKKASTTANSPLTGDIGAVGAGEALDVLSAAGLGDGRAAVAGLAFAAFSGAALGVGVDAALDLDAIGRPPVAAGGFSAFTAAFALLFGATPDTFLAGPALVTAALAFAAGRVEFGAASFFVIATFSGLAELAVLTADLAETFCGVAAAFLLPPLGRSAMYHLRLSMF
ncbi:MAG TPA: hypothetical protein VNT42_01890 [Sphingomonas sp.]|nr:hypothetical protein [Sphingomonas sp.]